MSVTSGPRGCAGEREGFGLTLLVEDDDVTAGEVDGVGSAEAGHCRRESARVQAGMRMPRGAGGGRRSTCKAGEYLQPPPTTITF